MGYRLNRLDEPCFVAVSKPLLTEFGFHHRLESCDRQYAFIFMSTGCVEIHNLCFQDFLVSRSEKAKAHSETTNTYD